MTLFIYKYLKSLYKSSKQSDLKLLGVSLDFQNIYKTIINICLTLFSFACYTHTHTHARARAHTHTHTHLIIIFNYEKYHIVIKYIYI